MVGGSSVAVDADVVFVVAEALLGEGEVIVDGGGGGVVEGVI